MDSIIFESGLNLMAKSASSVIETYIVINHNSAADPSVVTLSNGNYISVWIECIGENGNEVYAQLISYNGKLIDSSFQINNWVRGYSSKNLRLIYFVRNRR